MTPNWFKIKRYPHIGKPIKRGDFKWVNPYVTNSNNIASHDFTPFIHKTLVSRKYRAGNNKPAPGKRRLRIKDKKVRHIYYASHLDSIIYSYYNEKLLQDYEAKLRDEPFDSSVVAYRKIPIKSGSKNNKCNIDFAFSAFEHIKKGAPLHQSAIVADISNFFDSLDHQILKKNWSNVINTNTLPTDHYNIFKSLTKLRYVEFDLLFKTKKNNIPVERKTFINGVAKDILRFKHISKTIFLKDQRVIAFCTRKEFYKKYTHLIRKGGSKKGIPQGSPISATLANIYMFEFDKLVYSKINEYGGFYQRYSDDLIIVIPTEVETEILKFIRNKISNLKLEIHPSKTNVYRFSKYNDKYLGFLLKKEGENQLDKNYVLEYLGFTYDGQKVRIKTSGFSKFYRSMKRSFKKSTSLAKYSENPDNRIFKSRLYKRFTHVGASRRRIYRPSPDDPKKYVKTEIFDWGNYLSYVYKANSTMKAINGDDSLKSQSRRIWFNYHKLMNYHESQLRKYLERKSADQD